MVGVGVKFFKDVLIFNQSNFTRAIDVYSRKSNLGMKGIVLVLYIYSHDYI